MADQQKTANIQGLTTTQARERQAKYGKNELIPPQQDGLLYKILHVIGEPMFLLLIVAAIIYFILGEAQDGAVMLVFVLGIIAIDAIQEWKTDKTLNALKDLSAPTVTVVRDGRETVILSADLVPGDLMLIAEGVKIPADGWVVQASDLCVDESSLTGEAEGVWKTSTSRVNENPDANAVNGEDYWRQDYCYAGTLVTQGTAAILVYKTGVNTEYGKIGVNVATAPEFPTPLQKQTQNLVKIAAGIAAVLLTLVGVITYYNLPDHAFKPRIIESILAGITLAMAMIPEEFPVILTVFLSMGAWRLAKKTALVRKLPSVETLGAVSVLCVDKTGTITMNQMTVRDTWALHGNSPELTEIMGLACEMKAYDPMEKAILNYCESQNLSRETLFTGELIAEYPFTNETKMMGHVWQRQDKILIAAKGSPEHIVTLCELSAEEQKMVTSKILAMSQQGLRVIAVAHRSVIRREEIPAALTDCKLTLIGLIGLADPPRESVKQDIQHCVRAGVRVVMITGDNGITASSIAQQIGMPQSDQVITGDQLNAMTDLELQAKVKEVSVFSRVVPEHKMRIVKALRENGEIVAMTGDGVNDAPALKYADIGIAMGKRGSEVSREAADLILMDDNFSTIVETIRDGRRIYDNIRKAVGYVFTIHIPIALASLLAPLLNIGPGALLFLPLHVVLLELVIDPTCSIVLERQPAEDDIMERPPRNPKSKILTLGMILKSGLQGFAIFAASFATYYYFLQQSPQNAALARTMGLTVILIANILLVQVNSSNWDSVFHSVGHLIKDRVMWVVNLGTIAMVLIIVYTPVNGFLKLSPLTPTQLLLAVGIACIAVLWYELVKLGRNVVKNRRG